VHTGGVTSPCFGIRYWIKLGIYERKLFQCDIENVESFTAIFELIPKPFKTR
jgi:hypothetical protein